MLFTLDKCLVVIAVFCLVPQLSRAADPIVKGTTSYIFAGQYRPLDGVQVTVLRRSPVTSDTSHDGGNFTATFVKGSPVFVLFDGPDNHVPLLQALGANTDMEHVVHVTLYTIEQAQQNEINVQTHINAIISQLKAAKVDLTAAQLERLHTLARRAG